MEMFSKCMSVSYGECHDKKFIYLADISSAERPLDLALELLNLEKSELLSMGF